MTDIWSFLLQTLTASGAAALLLIVKAMFQDKLSPRWQFALWSVLALVLLAPAGWGGRYILFNWPQWVEILKTLITGEYGTLTKVLAPIPMPLTAPRTWADWLFLVYVAGVVVLLARYVASYARLRLALRQGGRIQSRQVKAVAERYGLPACPVAAVDGLPTAFICGVFRPVLALPAGRETDDKVILHELLHLKHRDVVWGWVIAFFRCVHWCNPLIWLCADWAGNDLESLCDQRVLERLEGEDRRDYGRILLSMAGEKYARAPGTSSASNGGENVRRRIEAIARFKRYPAGMALASVCVTVALAVPLVVGVRAEGVPEWRGTTAFTMSAARAVRCSTPAGAIDAYAKGILTGEFPYLAMCAPLDRQDALAAACDNNSHSSRTGTDWMMEQSGLPCWPSRWAGYRVFNLEQLADGSCEGLLVVQLNYPPDGQPQGEEAYWVAVQPIRAEKEGDRWVALPLGYFQAVPDVEGRTFGSFPMSEAVPARVYEAQAGDFTVRAECWTAGTLSGQPGESVDLVPHPHGAFGQFYVTQSIDAVYTGDPADKDEYQKIAVTSAPCRENGQRPALRDPRSDTYATGSSNSGASWGSQRLRTDWYDEILMLSGGGTTFDWERDGDHLPDRVAADLYLNDKLTAELTLLPVEGGGTTPTWSAAPELSLGRLPVEGGGARD